MTARCHMTKAGPVRDCGTTANFPPPQPCRELASLPPQQAPRGGCHANSGGSRGSCVTGRRRHGAGRGLSDAQRDGDRAVRRRRSGRHFRPHRRGHLLASSRAILRGRERRRRRRHGRHAQGRAGEARRLHPRRRPHGHQCRGADVLSEPRLRSGKGFRADRRHRHAGRAPGRAQGHPGEQPQGIRRVGQEEREQIEHGPCRRRLGVLSRLPALEQRDRHPSDPGAFHRHRAGDERHPRRQCRL